MELNEKYDKCLFLVYHKRSDANFSVSNKAKDIKDYIHIFVMYY